MAYQFKVRDKVKRETDCTGASAGVEYEVRNGLESANQLGELVIGGSNCLQKPYNIHRNRLKTLAFYY